MEAYKSNKWKEEEEEEDEEEEDEEEERGGIEGEESKEVVMLKF